MSDPKNLTAEEYALMIERDQRDIDRVRHAQLAEVLAKAESVKCNNLLEATECDRRALNYIQQFDSLFDTYVADTKNYFTLDPAIEVKDSEMPWQDNPKTLTGRIQKKERRMKKFLALQNTRNKLVKEIIGVQPAAKGKTAPVNINADTVNVNNDPADDYEKFKKAKEAG